MTKITSFTALDIRFPTSIGLHGSDAMNPDPDYSAAYCVLGTDVQGLEGHGMTFTIGRGNEICVAAINSLKGFVEGRSLEELTADMGRFWREVVGDSQLRWIGPEKGAIHLASAAVLNAVWDLWAKVEGKPLWGLIADMSAEELVRCVDFRFITDAITPDQAIALLRSRESGRDERESRMRSHGFPAYTTSVGWLGYTDDEVRARSQMALRQGFSHFKMKVGRDLDADIRRARLIREQIGWERQLMMDANQVWEVDQAIEWVKALAEFRPFWIEEPT
nr:fuconate dehydratase [Candidatus Dormibacteraeota bacterium]